MPSSVADRNLLYGILALQQELITREQLVKAMRAWVMRKDESLGAILQEQQAITPDARKQLWKSVDRHIENHGSEPRKILSTLSTHKSVWEQLNTIRDAELQESLAQLKSVAPADAYRTVQDFVAISDTEVERFRIVRLHARGGLGEVYIAQDIELRRDVALKEIQANYADDPSSRARFVREAEVTGGLEHPGIVPVYALGTYADGRPYYAMRFIKGDSLREAIEQFHGAVNGATSAPDEKLAGRNKNLQRAPLRSLEFRKLLGCLVDACNAVHYAHCRGVLHRDLKPANIMLGEYGETIVVDWGLAKILARENVPGEEHEATLRPTTASVNAETVLGFALGTPEYMSPEQAEGMWDHIGPTSDVYSLGATLYHALTGQPSVTGADLSEKLSKIQSGGIHWPRTINRQIPFALDAICRKAMALRPVDRYQTVRALADDIEHWLADEPVAACHENLIERSARWARRHKTRVAVLVVAGMFVMASLALVASVAGVKNRELDISNRQLKSSNQQLQAARSDAVAAAQRESLERRKSDLAAARSLFEQGYTRHQERSASNGMLLMVRALEQLESLGSADSFRETAESKTLDTQIRAFAQGVHNHVEGASTQLLPLRQMVDLRPDSTGKNVHFDLNGKTVSSLDFNGNERTWEIASGKKVAALAIPPGQALSWACDQELSKIMIGCSDHRARIYDLSRANQRAAILVHQSPVRYVAICADGTKAITGSDDGLARIWEVATGKQIGEAIAHRSLTSVAISADGSRVATVDGGSTRIWDSQSALQIGKDLVHPQVVNSVVINRDGSRVATQGTDGVARIWDTRTAGQLGRGHAHESLCCVAISPDGTSIMTGGRDGTVRIWKAETSAQIGEGLVHQGIERVAFSADGTRAVTGGQDGMVQVWDVTSGKREGAGFAHPMVVSHVDFSADGVRILTACSDDRIRIWNRTTKDVISEQLVHPSGKCLAISRDRSKVLAGSSDNSFQVWEMTTGVQIGGPVLLPVEMTCAALSDDGKIAITATKDNVARIWHLASEMKNSVSMVHPSPILSVAVNKEGSKIITGCQDGKARIWDVASGNQIGENIVHSAAIHSVAFARDSSTVLTGGGDGTARIWDSSIGRQIAESVLHNGSIYGVAFNPDGTRIITAGADGFARVWDISILRPSATIIPIPFSGWDCTLSPDGTVVAVGMHSTTADIFDVATAKQICSLSHPEPIEGIALSGARGKVVTLCSDNKTRIWNIPTGKQIAEINIRPVCVAISADGNTLATSDSKPRMWDMTTGKQIGVELHQADSTRNIALSGDGKRVVTGDPYQGAQIWDVATGKPIGESLAHPGGVRCLAFSPDGTKVITGSNKVRMWDALTGKRIFESSEYESVSVVAFSLDGTKIVAAAADTIRIWDVTTLKQIGEGLRQNDRISSVAMTPDGSQILTVGFLELSRWDLVKLDGSPELLRTWIEATAAASVDETTLLRPFSVDMWQSRISHLQKLGGPPKSWLDFRKQQQTLITRD